MVFMRCFVLVVLVAVIGCGGGGGTAVDPLPEPGVSMVRSGLDGVAQTGQLDSGMMSVQDGIEKLSSTDSEKAEKVRKGVEELKKLPDPESRKAKAKEILGQL